MLIKILLIDDDEDELDILEDAFRQMNIHADCSQEIEPENAIAALNEFRPDYLFLDFNMPKINGLTCLEEIRKVPALKQVRVILYSSNITREIEKKALQLGAIGCIEKTNSLSPLMGRLNKLMNGHYSA